MTFCDLCGELIEPWMRSDWYGDKFACGPECAEAHGQEGDKEMTLNEKIQLLKIAINAVKEIGDLSIMGNDIAIHVLDREEFDKIATPMFVAAERYPFSDELIKTVDGIRFYHFDHKAECKAGDNHAA